MPPSSPGGLSGDWPTAQRTSRNSATIGIFRKTISQMNVHASTWIDRIPELAPVQPHAQAEAQARSRVAVNP
jgi:hypothetical protein